MTRHRKMRRHTLPVLVLALLAQPALAAYRLLGHWCDDTGYRIHLTADRITFSDRQMGDPPDGTDLAFGDGIAVYRQDFRNSPWPHIDLIDCTLRLVGPDSAEETCRGPGFGFVPVYILRRCPTEHIS
ncbi:hypothetical protein [Dongia mobilis]|uniref:hypothetical protein n=1 Tax=Dongia sp. TaxID=1977262 RepID=UPI0026F2CDB7